MLTEQNKKDILSAIESRIFEIKGYGNMSLLPELSRLLELKKALKKKVRKG